MVDTSDTTFELGPFLLHRNKGREHYEAEEFALARRDLELANRIRPDDADVLYWLGTAYFRLDQYPEAERCFRQLIEKKPGYATLHVNRGIVLYKMNRPSEAEEEFLQALEIDRDTARAHLYLGLIHARRGDYRTALGHFEQSGAEVMAERMRRRLTGGRARREEVPVTEPADTARGSTSDAGTPGSGASRGRRQERTVTASPRRASPETSATVKVCVRTGNSYAMYNSRGVRYRSSSSAMMAGSIVKRLPPAKAVADLRNAWSALRGVIDFPPIPGCGPLSR